VAATNDFGGVLRAARERRGVSLQELSAATKIPLPSIEALERNDLTRLPGGVFTRGFVKTYAREVGLDPGETLQDFLDRFEAPPAPAADAPASGIDGAARNGLRPRAAVPLVGLVAIAAALGYGVLRGPWLSKPQTPLPTPVTAAPASGAPGSAVGTAGAASGPAAGAPSPAAGAVVLEFRTTAACWVGLTLDGRRVVHRVMQPGEAERHLVTGAALLRVGDAGAFAYTLDGRPGQSLGPRGAVRTIRISRETMAQFVR
jgi:cytoskeletal protein RodZ